jgi:hypothetical protein
MTSWKMYFTRKGQIRILRVCVVAPNQAIFGAVVEGVQELGTFSWDTSPCVFITAGPSTKLFTWGWGGYGRTCATRDDEPRPVWTSLPITH